MTSSSYNDTFLTLYLCLVGASPCRFDYTDTDSPQPDVARGALDTGENQDANQASSSVSIPSSAGLPTSKGSESESNWNVKDNWNRALPSFYPLEETNYV